MPFSRIPQRLNPRGTQLSTENHN